MLISQCVMGGCALISACDTCRTKVMISACDTRRTKVMISACGTGGAKELVARAVARTLRKGDGASMRMWE